MIEKELTGEIIKAFYKVYNALGHGFIESVYHNAMILELTASGLPHRDGKAHRGLLW